MIASVPLFAFCYYTSAARGGSSLANHNCTETSCTLWHDLSLHRNEDAAHKAIQRNNGHHAYPACTMRWDNLTALDHAILARIAYFQPELTDDSSEHQLQGMKQALRFAFPEALGYNVTLDEDWETHPLRKQQLEKDVFRKYYKIDFHNQKHTVIAVQGTDLTDISDILADLRLWIVSGMIDIGELLIPSLNLIIARHRANIQWFIDMIQESIIIDENQVRTAQQISEEG